MTNKSYYDTKTTRLSTDSEIRVYPATDEHPSFYELLGVSIDTEPVQDVLRLAVEDGCGDGPVWAEVTDNGDGGDGLWLSFELGDHAHDLFAVRLTTGQAEMLAEVLLSVVRLRRLR